MTLPSKNNDGFSASRLAANPTTLAKRKFETSVSLLETGVVVVVVALPPSRVAAVVAEGRKEGPPALAGPCVILR